MPTPAALLLAGIRAYAKLCEDAVSADEPDVTNIVPRPRVRPQTAPGRRARSAPGEGRTHSAEWRVSRMDNEDDPSLGAFAAAFLAEMDVPPGGLDLLGLDPEYQPGNLQEA